MLRRLVLVVLFLPLPAFAQMPSRAVMLEDWERNRKNVLEYLNAAPDSMLDYRYAPGVRNFAEQIDHASSSAAFIVSQVVMGASPPAALKGDTAVYLHNKAALQKHVNAQYDYVIDILKTIPEASLLAEREGFKIKKAAWRWAESAREHAVWTLGQTVPYMRNNKVRPPNFLPF